MLEFTLIEYFITSFCLIVAGFLIYMAYVWYLKKFRGYRYENGIPDVAILRQPSRSMGNIGFKHFSVAPYRTSQLSLRSVDEAKLMANSGRPYTFPLSSPGNSIIPEIRVDHIA